MAPLFHSTEENIISPCPICGQRDNFNVHIQNNHGPPESREPPHPDFAAFSWVLVHRKSDNSILLVNEPAGIAGGKPRYWLPAGRVDKGEDMISAAIREVREEGNVEVCIVGVMKFMLDGSYSSGMCDLHKFPVPRVVFLAHPIEQEPGSSRIPKSTPDFESCGAVWTSVEDLEVLGHNDFRGWGPQQLGLPFCCGKLNASGVANCSFRDFESVIRDLTTASNNMLQRDEIQTLGEQLHKAWEALQKNYPSDSFI